MWRKHVWAVGVAAMFGTCVRFMHESRSVTAGRLKLNHPWELSQRNA